MESATASALKERVRQQFAASAVEYVLSQGHASGPDLIRMIEVAAPTPDDLMLDVATGGGHVTRIFGPLVNQVVIADLTPIMLAAARRFLLTSGLENLESVAADAEALPFASERFSLVTCRIAPHHFPHPDRFVAEVARVLKPTGRFVLIDSTVPEDELGDFFNRFEKLRDQSHVRSLTVSEWTALCVRSGLDVELTETFRKRHNFVDWTSRSRTPAEVRTTLEQMMRALGDAVERAFETQWENDRLVSFSDTKTLFLARKPASD
mgnify:CR=1 FL=1